MPWRWFAWEPEYMVIWFRNTFREDGIERECVCVCVYVYILDKEVKRRKQASVEDDKIPGWEHSTCYTYLLTLPVTHTRLTLDACWRHGDL